MTIKNQRPIIEVEVVVHTPDGVRTQGFHK
jgi:hypothetical protein